MMKSILDKIMEECDEQITHTNGSIRYLDEQDSEFYATYDINDGEPIVNVIINDFGIEEIVIERHIYNKCIDLYNQSLDDKADMYYLRNLRY